MSVAPVPSGPLSFRSFVVAGFVPGAVLVLTATPGTLNDNQRAQSECGERPEFTGVLWERERGRAAAEGQIGKKPVVQLDNRESV